MIIEIAHFCSILAFVFYAVQSIYFFKKSDGSSMFLRRISCVNAGLISAAFLGLVYSYIKTDLSVLNVVINSHSLKPLLYKIAGTWGNHEGSMLLWCLVLALCNAGIALSQYKNEDKSKALSLHGFICFLFIGFLIFASNPFLRLFPPALQGQDLNPLLQDPALALHPPLLYLGYIILSVPFAFAFSGLLSGRINKEWAKQQKIWIISAWTFLSAGIALGSYWAYYELGWGGWWFWDPVENASLLPWLTTTALLHSTQVLEKRDALKKWTVLLSILAFSLSVLGTFLVRSGVLTSVHTFALDPERGLYILGILALLGGAGFTLYGIKAPQLKGTAFFAFKSRETLLLLNNLFLVTAITTILIGLLYPLILEGLIQKSISVGAPYYNSIILPLALPLLFFMGIAPYVPWKNASAKKTVKKLQPTLLVCLALIPLIYTQAPSHNITSTIGIVFAAWLILPVTQYALNKAKHNKAISLNEISLTMSHVGLGIAVIGMIGTGLWQQNYLGHMSQNQSEKLNGYNFTLEETKTYTGPNYEAAKVRFSIGPEDKVQEKELKDFIEPEKRFYKIAGERTTEVGIHTDIFNSLYIALGDYDEEAKKWVVRAYSHPLISFLWSGFILMVLGGFAGMAGTILQSRKNSHA